MGVCLKRFPGYELALNVYSGAVAAGDLITYFRGLDAAGVRRWVNYLHPTCDLSGLDVASIPDLKRTVASKLREYRGEGPVRSALVSASPVNALFLDFWPSYVGRDGSFPADPGVFSSFAAACEQLGLSTVACVALTEAAQAIAGSSAIL